MDRDGGRTRQDKTRLNLGESLLAVLQDETEQLPRVAQRCGRETGHWTAGNSTSTQANRIIQQHFSTTI
jgi:hypothetical protein